MHTSTFCTLVELHVRLDVIWRHSPILIFKITYLYFTAVRFLLLIILRFVKPFSFISSQLINIVLIVVHYVILVGRLYR